jgi:hypothetical protein
MTNVIGAAFPHKEATGLSIELKAVPHRRPPRSPRLRCIAGMCEGEPSADGSMSDAEIYRWTTRATGDMLKAKPLPVLGGTLYECCADLGRRT